MELLGSICCAEFDVAAKVRGCLAGLNLRAWFLAERIRINTAHFVACLAQEHLC
jgi:hypothetical protein